MMLVAHSGHPSVYSSFLPTPANISPGSALLVLHRLALVVVCVLVVQVDLMDVDLVLWTHIGLRLEALASVTGGREL